MKLRTIPKDEYPDYRLDVIFKGYKWDPQFLDNNTVAKHVLEITEEENEKLRELTEALDEETIRAEQLMASMPKLMKELKLPRLIRRHLKYMDNYDPQKHIRLNRYDFHPTVDKDFVVSEVNSDVPGGFAEASLMPLIAMSYLDDKDYRFDDFGQALTQAIAQKTPPGGNVMFVHCSSYSDDRQVMQFMGDRLEGLGYRAIYGASDHLIFEKGQAHSILDGNACRIDAIVRFTPLEWLVDVKPRKWNGYFNTVTPSCNHPVAVLAQTKRFPFVWDDIESAAGINDSSMFKTWRELLPETLSVKDAKGKDGFLYKPVWGRVGEKISIKEACRDDEYAKIMKEVKRRPGRYVAQKRFESKPLTDESGENYHVCIGAFCVEGMTAGYYARLSKTPRIDSGAADIPVVIGN